MEQETLINTFCKLQKKLHSVAGRLLRDEMEAEDAVQDTFYNVWKAKLPDNDDQARFKMFAVLKNVCLNKLKRKQPITGTDLSDIAVDPPPADDDTCRIREELLKYLTPTQREVFLLSTDQDMEYEEIAQRLGISIEATRMNMSRARKTLREQYKKLNL